MKVLVRGIPDFTYTQAHEVSDLDTFVNTFNLRVRTSVFIRCADYIHAESKKRVQLYVEGVQENMESLLGRCFDPKPRAMKTCVVRLKDDGRIWSAGTSSSIETGGGRWYMVEPKLDPRYPALLSLHKEEVAREARAQAALQDREDELREQILDAASDLGYEEALRILKGKKDMKQFDFRFDISGSRVVIYPKGTLARRAQGRYVDAPYIDIRRYTEFSDRFELVRCGHVVKQGSLPFRHGYDLDESIDRVIDLMKEL